MRLMLFVKLFCAGVVLSLLYFVFTDADITGLLKAGALTTAMAITISALYPEIRGIKKGDRVAVVSDSATPGFLGKIAQALCDAKKRQKIRVRMSNGREALAVVESHGGIISPPKVRVIYEEKVIE